MDLHSAPGIEAWDGLPSVVERNFLALLDLLDEYGVKSTCFFLGWIAERFPSLVKEAAERGHEIASHGYGHGLVYRQSPDEFFQDVSRAKELLEELAGVPVKGYRAPGFSVTEDTPWFFKTLARAGYSYDSSVFPAPRLHGGLPTFPPEPSLVRTEHGTIAEVPISVTRMLGRRMCFFGGGYLRLFPSYLIHSMTRTVLSEGKPVIFYIHPREIDASHPRLKMPLSRRVRSYVGLKRLRSKLERVLQEFRFLTFCGLLKDAKPNQG